MGTMFYYARSVYPTMIQEINDILRSQSRPKWDTKYKARMLLDYAAKYPNEILRYKASDIVLHVDSDAEYITMIEARICYAGHFYLRYCPSPSAIKPNPNINGPIHTECKTILDVVSSAAEAETCGTFNNRKTYIGMRQALIALDHNQPATPLNTKNSTT